MSSAVVVAGLGKSYGAVRAVRGVSFAVARGEIFALLGPNGAGKTTTLEILEGFRTRDAGRAEVLGLDPGDRATGRALRERIGLVLQDIAVEPYLTVRETVARNAGYYPAPRGVDEVIALVGLAGQARQKVRVPVRRPQRRLDLALGMIGDPELLFLDEPTTGFDPSARRGAWQIMRGLREAGTTIVLTHPLHGRGAGAGRPGRGDGRRPDRRRGHPVSDRRPRHRAGADPVRPACRDRGRRPAGRGGRRGTTAWSPCRPPSRPRTLHQLTGWALDHGTVLDRLTVDRPSLEDVYLRLTGHGELARVMERSTR